MPKHGHESANVCANQEVHVDIVKTEIGQLEKVLDALIRRPRLIRREYWISQIENLLEKPRLSPLDRQRLHALRDLLGDSPADSGSTYA
nr:hypothetical protein [Paraburkholderia sacchari]